MKRFYKGASLGFSITAALLAAIILCAPFVSCGRTHPPGTTGAASGVGATHASPAGEACLAPTIPLADALKQIDAYPAPEGVSSQTWTALTTDLKRLLIARASGSKTISIAPTGTMNAVTDLAAVSNPAGTQATLTWTEVLPGDYDNNGTVDAGDLVPIAQYYTQRTDSGPDDAHRLVVGDGDPEINLADLQAIVSNYGAHLQGYQVWRGHFNGTSTDWETTIRPNTNPANADWSADRPSPPPVSARPTYAYTDDITALTDKDNVRYKVTAYGDGAAGEESREAVMPSPPTFSVSGTVTLLGNGFAGVTLTLDPGGLLATTQVDGSYSIADVANGAYTLTPTGTGYAFAPATVPVTVNGANVQGLDFTATGGLASSAWPKFHGNAQNTGQSPYVGAQTNHVKWSFVTENGLASSPPAIGADGTVYVGSGYFYALNPSDGTVKWRHAIGVHGSPAIGADGTVYVGSEDNKVYALNPIDGSVKWTYATGGSVGSSPAIGADGTIYIGSGDYKVYALNPLDGSVKWMSGNLGAMNGSPAIGLDGTIYVGMDYALYALSSLEGSVKWSYGTGHPVVGSPAIGADGTIYLGSRDGNLYALNPRDGSVKWSHTTYPCSSPAIGADGLVCVGGGDNKIYALRSSDGTVRWSYVTGGPVESSPAIGADGTIYVGSDDWKVYGLNPTDGSEWSYTTGDTVKGSPAIGTDGTVYIWNDEGYLYAFGP